jgi:inositol transport system ATP-binding protein
MDEPTSALSEADARRLFGLIADLKAQGKGILYITHRMDELYRIADEITVLRDGRVVGSGTAVELPRQVVIRLMVGRELSLTVARAAAQRGAVALAARSLTLAPYFREVSFELHAGEVLGVAGLIGAGRSELAETLFGARRPEGGSLAVAGREVRIDSPRTATALGLAFVTEDRKESGCFLPLSVLENLQIAVLAGEYLRFGFVRERALQRACHAVSESLRVKTPDLAECIGNLSGGNQQKVLIGRWLLRQPQIFLLDEPTRGVDVGAKAEIHQLIGRLVERGAAVLMISSELPEVLSMSDRVMVMRAGRVSGILERAAADPVTIMELAAA